MIINGQTKFTGVIGQNIGYSRSPLIHNYWYKTSGINGVYIPFEAQLETFEMIIRGLFAAGCGGVNVTVPFKEQAYHVADHLTPEARQAGVVNVLYPSGGKIYGHNTDGFGLIASIKSLKSNFVFQDNQCLIIGAGGAAMGIITALSDAGISHFSIINRSFDKIVSLCETLKEKYPNVNFTPMKSYDDINGGYPLIIQTSSVKKHEAGNILDIPLKLIHENSVVIDINYGFTPHDFLDHISASKCFYANGLDMLVQQARPSFALFNQTELPEYDQELKEIIYF